MTMVPTLIEQTIKGGQARVFIATQAQAKTNPSVVTGQLTFHSCYLYVLVDSSVNHNFITYGIIKRLRLKPTYIDSVYSDLSNTNKITNDQILLDERVTLRARDTLVDLIVFDMLNFDMILGMDFLSQYEAEIVCRKKTVRFYLDNLEKFTFKKG